MLRKHGCTRVPRLSAAESQAAHEVGLDGLTCLGGLNPSTRIATAADTSYTDMKLITTVGLLGVMVVAGCAKAPSPSDPREPTPSSIEVTEDVSLEPYEYEREGKRFRAILQFFNDEEKVVIRRGQRFQMISSVGQMEGGCRIRFEGKDYELASCFWQGGFADNRSNIFVVIEN